MAPQPPGRKDPNTLAPGAGRTPLTLCEALRVRGRGPSPGWESPAAEWRRGATRDPTHSAAGAGKTTGFCNGGRRAQAAST